MTTALLVIGNGRLQYLHSAIESAYEHCPEFDYLLMVDDSGDPAVREELDDLYPEFTIRHHDQNLGMAVSVQDGFFAVLATDADYVLWLEEDMVLRAPIPLIESIKILDAHPHIAQMLYQRQVLTPDEYAAGSVVGAMRGTNHGAWTQQRHIFSLNPCIIPRRVLEHGWHSDNERGMTKKLLDAGYTFGVWNETPMVEHVGVERGAQWQL